MTPDEIQQALIERIESLESNAEAIQGCLDGHYYALAVKAIYDKTVWPLQYIHRQFVQLLKAREADDVIRLAVMADGKDISAVRERYTKTTDLLNRLGSCLAVFEEALGKEEVSSIIDVSILESRKLLWEVAVKAADKALKHQGAEVFCKDSTVFYRERISNYTKAINKLAAKPTTPTKPSQKRSRSPDTGSGIPPESKKARHRRGSFSTPKRPRQQSAPPIVPSYKPISPLKTPPAAVGSPSPVRPQLPTLPASPPKVGISPPATRTPPAARSPSFARTPPLVRPLSPLRTPPPTGSPPVGSPPAGTPRPPQLIVDDDLIAQLNDQYRALCDFCANNQDPDADAIGIMLPITQAILDKTRQMGIPQRRRDEERRAELKTELRNTKSAKKQIRLEDRLFKSSEREMNKFYAGNLIEIHLVMEKLETWLEGMRMFSQVADFTYKGSENEYGVLDV